MKTSKRRRIWPQAVLDRATELLLPDDDESKMSPRRVAALLQDEFPKEYAAGRVPTYRTLYDMRRDLQPAEEEHGLWSLSDGDPEEARLALPVMRELNRTGHGLLGWNLPRELVRWIAVVRTADPEIPLVESFYLALRYLQAKHGIGDPQEADRWLVMQLWRNRPPRLTLNEKVAAVFAAAQQAADTGEELPE